MKLTLLCYITIMSSIFVIMFAFNLRRLKRTSDMLGYDITGAIRASVNSMLVYSIALALITVLSILCIGRYLYVPSF